jgi:hypothetical protein
MNTSVRRARALALVTLSGAVLAGLAGCSSSVPADQVGSTIVTQLKGQGVTVDGDAVSCPADLQAEVGQTVRCGFTAGGQPVDAVAKVSSVDGGTVNFDISTEAKPVPKAVLEKTVTEQLVKGNVPAERTTCAGDLAPQVGQSQTCTATGGGGDILLTTTVTEVRGGLVNFSIGEG